MLKSSGLPTISKIDMANKLEDLMDKKGVSEVCYDAVIYYFLNYPPEMSKILDLIEPITIQKHPNGSVSIEVDKNATQSDLEEFIKLKYSKAVKPNGKRLNIKSKAKEVMIIDSKINKGMSYKDIQDQLIDRYDVIKEDANLRTIISNYKKSIK